MIAVAERQRERRLNLGIARDAAQATGITVGSLPVHITTAPLLRKQTCREMTWSERWRWLRLRTTGRRLTDRDLKAADELKAVLYQNSQTLNSCCAPPHRDIHCKNVRWSNGI